MLIKISVIFIFINIKKRTILYFMECKSCKKRTPEQMEAIKNNVLNNTKGIQKGIIWFTVIWTLFALYGVYSLICNIF
jgi:hypothetical protein